MISQANIEILVFKSGEYTLGLEGEEVIEVINSPKISLPGKECVFLEGETSFREENVPVVALYKKWRSPFAGKNRSVIFVSIEDNIFGILVDSVEDVFEMRLSELNKFPDFIKYASGIDFIWSIAKKGGELIPILDLDKILNKHEKEIIIKYRRNINE
ncbi:MAG: chemotaxis protein CheW [bacterium]